ncbi:MAG: hypothetical protein MUF57_01290, partial [Gammaproteobacteria bacterium]|nr:hypothetical protein [Gammaproteobacteria bacterium]
IRDNGCKSGLVFNPATPLSHLTYVMDKIDMILLMSVNPGFGGQSFIPSALTKLREARRMIDESGFDIRLEIDGGVKTSNIREIKAAGADTFVAGSATSNIREIKAAGADTFVAGSAIFSAGKDGDPNRYDTIIRQMRDELAKAG